MIKVTTITITFILILFSGLGINDLKYYENTINEEERLQQLESQVYDFSQALFMIPLIYASSDDDDKDDKNDESGKDDDNVNELGKEKNAERDFDMSVAELMDTVDQFKTSDFVYMCHYMKDVGHFKQEVNCLDWAMNDPNPEESIKNFAILKGAGLYD